MANFVEWALEPRTQFIFTLFDNDRSGFLSMVGSTSPLGTLDVPVHRNT